jgi:hypothetical protein
MTREYNERMTAAYHAAVIPLMKKTPKLETLLISDALKKTARRQSGMEQFAAFQGWMEARKR